MVAHKKAVRTKMERDDVKKLIDEALAVHVYEHHKQRNPHFKPPSREEVGAYAREMGLALAVEIFMDFYESKGWKVGLAPMKDWKAAARRAVREGWARLTLPPKTIAEAKPKEVIENTTLEQRRGIAMQNAKLAEKLKPRGIGHSQKVFEARRQENLRKLDLVQKMKKPPMKLTGEPVKADFDNDPALGGDLPAEDEGWERG